MRLTRSNDDPKLLDDLERLARVHGDPDRTPRPLTSELTAADVAALEAEAAAARAAEDAEAGEPTPLDDPFVRRFVQVSVHLKRYAPFYAGAAVWALAMLLIQPLGGGDRSDTADLASASTPSATRAVPSPVAGTGVPASATEPIETAAPTFDDFGGSSLSSTSASSFDTFDDSSSFSSSSSTSDTFAGADDSSGTATFDDSEFSSDDFGDDPEHLAIVASGYASAIGGTPLEQDPGAGILPVAATGGNDNKRSFLRLTGEETTLQLKEAADGQVRPDAGGIKACLITADWQPARGAALSAGPAFDANNCATGTRSSDGTWSFDLSPFAPLAEAKGFALTPAAGTASTFEVRFVGTAVAPST